MWKCENRNMKIPKIITQARKESMDIYYHPKFRISQVKQARYVMYKSAGVICFGIIDSLTRRVLIIEDLFVGKKFRNQGIGSKLIERVMEIAKKEKVDCIDVCTKESNKIAQKFYKGLGFEDRKNKALRLWIK